MSLLKNAQVIGTATTPSRNTTYLLNFTACCDDFITADDFNM